MKADTDRLHSTKPQENPMSHPSHIALSRLQADSANVRRTGRGAEPLFTASLRARGVKLPFIVRPNSGDTYKVVDGGKRHDALIWLRDHGESAAGTAVTDAFPVPVLIEDLSDAQAREVSLTTHVRAQLHPVDRHEAISDLAADGKSRAEIAAEYAMTERELDQVLALGALSPAIRRAWRDQAIDAEVAKAFTLAGDHKTQDRVFKDLSAGGQDRIDADDVKDRLKANENDGGTYAQFVGIEAYEKRGGKVTRDLFGADHIVSNAKLAKAMAEEKLEEECKRLMSEGWSWALPEHRVKDKWRYGSINVEGEPTAAEKAETDRLGRLCDDYNHPDHDRAHLELDRFERAIALRAVTPAHMAKSGCIVSIDDGGALKVDFGRLKPKQEGQRPTKSAKPEKKAAPTPAEKKRAEAAKQKAAETGDVSKSLAQDLETQLLQATRRALKAEAARFPKGSLAASLALVAAELVEPDQRYHRALDDKALDAFRVLIAPGIMNEACRHEFQARDYFTRVPKHFIAAAVKEAIGADEARQVAAMKTEQAAKCAIANVPKTGWLPVALRTVHYDGPGSGAGKPAKAAGKKRRAA